MTEHEQCIRILRAKNESPIHLDPSRTALIEYEQYFQKPSR